MAYRGKALLIVNVASKCGFPPQDNGLQALHAQCAPRGFAVLAGPTAFFNRIGPNPALWRPLGLNVPLATVKQPVVGMSAPS